MLEIKLSYLILNYRYVKKNMPMKSNLFNRKYRMIAKTIKCNLNY